MTAYLFSDEDKRKLNEMYAWMRTFNGAGVTNTPRGATIRRPSVSRGSIFMPDRSVFMAMITGNASLATNRWKYAWSEVDPDGDVVVTVSTANGGRSGTTGTDYAVNLAEMYHTSTYAWGVDTTGTAYPAGFAPRPVGGGGGADTHRYNVPVWMHQLDDGSGGTVYRFWAMGSHDGTCDAP